MINGYTSFEVGSDRFRQLDKYSPLTNADLTPRIVREGASGVISAQWSCRGHWMEVGLQSHSRTVHGYCLFLRGDGSDQMSRVNVHSCSPKYWTSRVLRLSWRCWSFNPVVYPQW